MILAICVFLILVIIAVILLLGHNQEKKIKVGFIMTGYTQEKGWNGMHYQGVLKACEKLHAELLVKENVSEMTGECPRAVDELVDEGADLIILSSYNYAAEAADQFHKYKNVVFYCSSFDTDVENAIGYFVRYYQARYLAGIVAGMQTQTNEIGYVAAFDVPEVNRGISAFALGVRSVNPDAVVRVAWSGTWDDAGLETRIAQELVDHTDVDVLTYHQNQENVARVAEDNGIYSIGYHQPMEEASDRYLTAVVCDWEKTYTELLSGFIKGKESADNISWLGLETDVVGLSGYSPEVTEECAEAVEAARQRMLDGWNVFSGEIYDNQGNLRCMDGETIGDDLLLRHFDWYVNGVEFFNNPR